MKKYSEAISSIVYSHSEENQSHSKEIVGAHTSFLLTLNNTGEVRIYRANRSKYTLLLSHTLLIFTMELNSRAPNHHPLFRHIYLSVRESVYNLPSFLSHSRMTFLVFSVVFFFFSPFFFFFFLCQV